MAEGTNKDLRVRRLAVRHRGRLEQIWIYFGKLMRMFIYQNDWKVLPMAAIIAALVSMVVRRSFFKTMEGDLGGAFAMTCVAIWNGCFNSIQVICRERGIVKREHRSGMHVTSYIISHMLYQALLCAAQTAVTLYTMRLVGVSFPTGGFITRFFMLDIGFTLFLVTYAADMMSLFISSFSRTTTSAMTVMPFVLIFQLVFSGGPFFNLPQWAKSMTRYTVSSYGLKCIAAQADYNNAPNVTAWNMLQRLRDYEVGGTVTVGQVLDFATNENINLVRELRSREIHVDVSVAGLWNSLKKTETYQELRNVQLVGEHTLGDILTALRTDPKLAELRAGGEQSFNLGHLLDKLYELAGELSILDIRMTGVVNVGNVLDTLYVDDILSSMDTARIDRTTTVGQLIDLIAGNADVRARRDQPITLTRTVGQLIDMLGEDNVRETINRRTADVSKVEDYALTKDNIYSNWIALFLFAMFFVLAAIILLEFIDKDKR